MSHRTLITLCTYNERENITRMVPTIRELLPDADIVVVDDSSPDGTGELVDQFAADDSHILAIHRTERGLGGATIAAFRFAVEQGYDRVVNLDADFSHPPEKIPELLARLDAPTEIDVCVGSRYIEGGAIDGWPLRRHLMSRAVNGYARLMLGIPVRDTSGSFRAYRGDLLRKIDFDSFRSNGYSVQGELLYHCRRARARFAEVPITFVDRELGASKIRLRDGWLVLKILGSLRFFPPKIASPPMESTHEGVSSR